MNTKLTAVVFEDHPIKIKTIQLWDEDIEIIKIASNMTEAKEILEQLRNGELIADMAFMDGDLKTGLRREEFERQLVQDINDIKDGPITVDNSGYGALYDVCNITRAEHQNSFLKIIELTKSKLQENPETHILKN